MPLCSEVLIMIYLILIKMLIRIHITWRKGTLYNYIKNNMYK